MLNNYDNNDDDLNEKKSRRKMFATIATSLFVGAMISKPKMLMLMLQEQILPQLELFGAG